MTHTLLELHQLTIDRATPDDMSASIRTHTCATVGNQIMYTCGEPDAYKRVGHGEDQRRDQATRQEAHRRQQSHERHTARRERESWLVCSQMSFDGLIMPIRTIHIVDPLSLYGTLISEHPKAEPNPMIHHDQSLVLMKCDHLRARNDIVTDVKPQNQICRPL